MLRFIKTLRAQKKKKKKKPKQKTTSNIYIIYRYLINNKMTKFSVCVKSTEKKTLKSKK